MAYLSSEQLARMGFKALGKEVKISDRASIFEDVCSLACGVKMFSLSDDYSGQALTKSPIPTKYKNEMFAAVHVHFIAGARAVAFPGVVLAEDCAMGAMLVTKSTNAWDSVAGVSAK